MSPDPRLYLALVHYPVLDKNGLTVATSVTNLDIHDIARSARTYGVAGYFLVTPVENHHWLTGRVLAHWAEGNWGHTYNPNRTEALGLARLATDLKAVSEAVRAEAGTAPSFVVTSAKRYSHGISYTEARRRIADPDGPPVCLVFGTGWGLHPDTVRDADAVLDPIEGPTPYNHLSVRAAAAIILDRLMAPDRA